MNEQDVTYYFDRLMRALARANVMTEAQRKSLANEILIGNPPPALKSAAEKLATSTLAEADVMPYFKRMDTEAYRKAKGTKGPDVGSEVDARLAALLQTVE